MTMTTVRSAYPASIEDLMPRARALADAEGLPSQNRLKENLRIGRPKAREIRAALEDEGYTPARPEPVSAEPTAPAPAESEPVGSTVTDEADANPGPEPSSDEPAEAIPAQQAQAHSNAPDRASGAQDDTIELPAVTVDEQDTTETKQQTVPVADPGTPAADTTETEAAELSGTDEADTETGASEPGKGKRVAVWPVLLLLLPATVAIWSGWVGLGKLAGFGPMHPLPGIADEFEINTAITLPIGMETYSAYALYVWLSGRASAAAVKFARTSAFIALSIGSAGQIAYHLIAAPDAGAGPIITAIVACIPVAVLGLGAALGHLVRNGETT